MFTITGHPVYRSAATPNRVALYIAADVYAPSGGFSGLEISERCALLTPGDSVTFVPFTHDDLPFAPNVVVRKDY